MLHSCGGEVHFYLTTIVNKGRFLRNPFYTCNRWLRITGLDRLHVLDILCLGEALNKGLIELGGTRNCCRDALCEMLDEEGDAKMTLGCDSKRCVTG